MIIPPFANSDRSKLDYESPQVVTARLAAWTGALALFAAAVGGVVFLVRWVLS